MGQRENSNRQASLDDEKARGQGRMEDRSPEREAIKDAMDPVPMKGATGGAFGKDGHANDTRGSSTQGGGGGGGAQSPAKDNDLTTGAKHTPARKH